MLMAVIDDMDGPLIDAELATSMSVRHCDQKLEGASRSAKQMKEKVWAPVPVLRNH